MRRVPLTLLFILSTTFASQRQRKLSQFQTSIPRLPSVHLALPFSAKEEKLATISTSNAYIPVKGATGQPTSSMNYYSFQNLVADLNLPCFRSCTPQLKLNQSALELELMFTFCDKYLLLPARGRFMGKSFAQRFRRHRYFLVWAEDKS